MDRITESFSVRLSVLYDTGNELTDVAMFRYFFYRHIVLSAGKDKS